MVCAHRRRKYNLLLQTTISVAIIIILGHGTKNKHLKPAEVHLVLLAKVVMVLQGMIHRLPETERCYGIEMNVGGGGIK
jgi:hypothetical protein